MKKGEFLIVLAERRNIKRPAGMYYVNRKSNYTFEIKG